MPRPLNDNTPPATPRTVPIVGFIGDGGRVTLTRPLPRPSPAPLHLALAPDPH